MFQPSVRILSPVALLALLVACNERADFAAASDVIPIEGDASSDASIPDVGTPSDVDPPDDASRDAIDVPDPDSGSDALDPDSGSDAPDLDSGSDAPDPDLDFDAADASCEGPNPAGCRPGECPEGERCELVAGACRPSGCLCDPAGWWVCTEDCGGGVCVGVPPCRVDEECPPPTYCEDGTCQDCPDVDCAGCPPGTRERLRNGCFLCECEAVDECEDDEECGPEATCAPGECRRDCDPAAPGCCVGRRCVPTPDPCEGPNPAGCSAEGCPEGEVCERPSGICAPSFCACDPLVGWVCTGDCGGGGRCAPGVGCEDDGDCERGRCVDGRCATTPDCRADVECPRWSICDEGDCVRPDCGGVWEPVCGFDDRTYANRCLARAAHVAVAFEGECEDIPERCEIDDDCPVGTLCVSAACTPVDCSGFVDPVCGADGVTYGNECFASLAHALPVTDGPCLGCFGDDGCPDDMACNAAVECLPPPDCPGCDVCWGWCVAEE